jgi:hypothetical protein
MAMVTQPKKKQGLGCFGIGCLIVVIVFVLIIAGLGAAWFYTVSKVKPYTADTAAQVPVESVPPQQYEEIRRRVANFAGSAPGTRAVLTLTAQDVNALIAQSPEWNGAKGKIYVRIPEDHVALLGSVPLDKVPGFGGRYLNGGIYFRPSVNNGLLEARILKITAETDPLSEQLTKQLAPSVARNITTQFERDSVLGPAIRRADSLTVAGGKLTFSAQ